MRSITHQQHLTRQVFLIGRLLEYLPHCTTAGQKEKILQEVRRMWRRVWEMQQMSQTEQHTEVKTVQLTIESLLCCG